MLNANQASALSLGVLTKCNFPYINKKETEDIAPCITHYISVSQMFNLNVIIAVFHVSVDSKALYFFIQMPKSFF